MNRSSLKHGPFISALMAFAAGVSFGTKPTPEEIERRQKSAVAWMPFVSKPKFAIRHRHCLPANIIRARRKMERHNRHAAQRRLRVAA